MSHENGNLRNTAENYLSNRVCGTEIGATEAPNMMLDDEPLANSIVFSKVASDEYSYVPQAARIYADQEPPEGGLSVVFGFNSKPLDDPATASRTWEAALQAQHDYPELDLRLLNLGLFSEYDDDGIKKNCILPEISERLVATGIGKLATQELADDPLLHFHDIDLAYLSPGFFKEMKRAQQQNPGASLMPSARHDVYPDKPLLSAAIIYCDMHGLFSPKQPPIFEAATAMPLSAYCAGDGYYGTVTEMQETADLVRRAESATGKDLVFVQDAELRSSPRRLASRFLHGRGVVWGQEFESSEDPNYRSEFDIGSAGDITEKLYKEMINSTTQSNIDQHKEDIKEYVQNTVDNGSTFEEARDSLWNFVTERLASTALIEECEESLYQASDDNNKRYGWVEPTLKLYAHRYGVIELEDKFKVNDINLIVQNGMTDIHEYNMDEARRIIRNKRLDLYQNRPFERLYNTAAHIEEGTEPRVRRVGDRLIMNAY